MFNVVSRVIWIVAGVITMSGDSPLDRAIATSCACVLMVAAVLEVSGKEGPNEIN